MENKGFSSKVRSYNKDDLSNAKKIANTYIKLIQYQEQLFNVVYKDGKWIRRRKCHNKKK